MDTDKLRNAILFFAGHRCVPRLGLTKLHKLVYFADVLRSRETSGKSITGSEYIRYDHGPVPSRGERVIKKMKKEGKVSTRTVPDHGYERTQVEPNREADLAVFSGEETSILEKVAREFGPLTATELSHRSHEEPAWMDANPLEPLDPTLMLYGAEEDPEGL